MKSTCVCFPVSLSVIKLQTNSAVFKFLIRFEIVKSKWILIIEPVQQDFYPNFGVTALAVWVTLFQAAI